MADLTLWQIEAELAELFNAREQLVELGEDLAPIDQAIQEYVAREVRKVDNIRGYIRHAEMMVAAAEAEAAKQKARAEAWQGRIDRLKAACKYVMETMPWQVGKTRRIDGSTGSLVLKTNGGKQAVTITKPELVPEELVQYDGQIAGAAMESLRALVTSAHGLQNWVQWRSRRDVQIERIPHRGWIGEALGRQCDDCNGYGTKGGEKGDPKCEACDGDGRARVPGAHLEPRGSHVEVK